MQIELKRTSRSHHFLYPDQDDAPVGPASCRRLTEQLDERGMSTGRTAFVADVIAT